MGTYSDKISSRKKAKPLAGKAADDLVNEVRDNIQTWYEAERNNLEEATLDQRFRANDQWPDAARRQRESDGRPVLTFNRLNTFIAQVVNPLRQADKAIKARPDENVGDPTLAKICDGLFRKIQRHSMANVVLGHAIDCQAGCGIGWLRVCNDYKSNESFDQDIYLKKVENPLSVFWDTAARGPVKEDMMWGGVTEMWPEATFKAKWPKADPSSVESPNAAQNGFFWRTANEVRVAEYYKRVPVKKQIAQLISGEVIELDKAADIQDQVQQVREVDAYRVEKYMVSGTEILEGPSEVPGCYIPLVPAIGGEIALESGTYRFGVIRFARDAQKMYNLNRTAMAEWIGQAPVATWLLTDKMKASHRGQWESSNVTRRTTLSYTPDKEAPTGKPERIDPPQMPVALAQESQFAAEDMKSGTGIHDASLGAKSNETSGVAIQRRQIEGDTANYHISANFEATLLHIGTIMMEWLPVIYDTPRTVLLVGEDGEEHPTPINTPMMDPQTGQMVVQNDLSKAKFGVIVKIGPSITTRREESALETTEFMKVLPPEQAALITDIVARNQDWDGHEEVAKRLKATIPPQIIAQAEAPPGPDGKPQPLPPPEPNPFEIAELEYKKAQTAKLQADIEQILAGIKKTGVDTEKTLADTAHVVVQAKQLDRMDGIVDFPGNAMGGQNPETGNPASAPKRMDESGARPNYLQ